MTPDGTILSRHHANVRCTRFCPQLPINNHLCARNGFAHGTILAMFFSPCVSRNPREELCGVRIEIRISNDAPPRAPRLGRATGQLGGGSGG